MFQQIIDTHIHLDQYQTADRQQLLSTLAEHSIEALVAVSTNVASANVILQLAAHDRRIRPAVGFHPEQELPDEEEVADLLALIENNKNRIAAVGEIGLPYYLRQEQPDLKLAPYMELLEVFIRKAAEVNLPVALHAVYDDAPAVLDLLEKHHVKKAHFHWFKGDPSTIGRLVANGYMVSVTPEVVYREKIREIVRQVPLSQLMVETDGPWPFEERFAGKMTHPRMMHESVRAISELKQIDLEETYRVIYETARGFYGIG